MPITCTKDFTPSVANIVWERTNNIRQEKEKRMASPILSLDGYPEKKIVVIKKRK